MACPLLCTVIDKGCFALGKSIIEKGASTEKEVAGGQETVWREHQNLNQRVAARKVDLAPENISNCLGTD
jgi:hypothetical protein